MIARLRLLVVLARPAVLLLLGLYAATGTARGGRPDDHLLLVTVLVVVAALLLFSVAVNDLADEAIDRVNLPGARSRPLVTGTGRRTELRIMAVAGAVLAPVAALPLGWRCVLVAVSGMAVVTALGAAGALVLLAMLATDGGHRRDERLISALAIVGRGLLVVLLLQLSLHRPPVLLTVALVAIFAAQAGMMAARGPSAGPGVPAGWSDQYSRQSITTARSSAVSVGTSRTRNAAPPR